MGWIFSLHIRVLLLPCVLFLTFLSFSLSSPLPPAVVPPSALCRVRSLVDILRHQSSPVQQGERNNTTGLTSTTSDGRTSKNLYTPILQSKDNRSKWRELRVKTAEFRDSLHTFVRVKKHKPMLSYSGEMNVWTKPTCHVPGDMDGNYRCSVQSQYQ